MTKDNPAHVDVRLRDLLVQGARSRGLTILEDVDFRRAEIRNHRVYLGDFCVSDLDHLFWMGVLDRDRDSYHLEVLRLLGLSMKTYNSYEFFNAATDKYSAFSLLHHHGLPVADLRLVTRENVEVLRPQFEKHAFLLKPRRSSFGIGIVKVDEYEQLRDIIEYHPKKSFYLERFYPNEMADWIGITVFNGAVLYGFRKKHTKVSGWKVYDEKRVGGEVEYVKPPPEVARTAVEIGRALGGNFFGLDFIKTEEGYKVVDINCYPGMYYDMMKDLDLPVVELFFAPALRARA